MDEDVGVGSQIALQADQVLHRHHQDGNRGIRPYSAPLGDDVPVSSGRQLVQPSEFGDVGDYLVFGHDGHAGSRLGQSLKEIGPVGQHIAKNVSGLVVRSIGHRG